MIDLILDLVYHFFEKASKSANEGSRSQRRDTVRIAAVLAVILMVLSAACLIRGWQTNDSYYIVAGFLCLSLTLLEIIRLIRQCRKQ